MGMLSRRKGKKWEQECAAMLRPIFGDQVKRGLAQSRFGACEAPDVTNVPGLWVECKHSKLVNLRAALTQAITAEQLCREHTIAAGFSMEPRRPVAFCKDNNEKPVAVLRLEDFIEIVRELWQLKTGDGLEKFKVAVLSEEPTPSAEPGGKSNGSQT